MYGGEKPLARAVVENGAQQPERPVGGAEAVTMGQIEHLAVDFRDGVARVQHHAAFFRQVVLHPQIVVPCEIMHLDAQIRQFAELSQEAGVALRHDGLVFVPEVEHVAQQIDGGGLVLDTVQEIHQPAFLHAAVRDGQTAQVGVGQKIYVLHTT